MNYTGFTLYGLFALILLISSIYVAFLIKNRSSGWMQGIGLIFVGGLLLMLLGRSLFHRYQLDERLVDASSKGNAVQVRRLLAQGANPNVRWNDGVTALNSAQKAGHPDIVGILQNAGAKE